MLTTRALSAAVIRYGFQDYSPKAANFHGVMPSFEAEMA